MNFCQISMVKIVLELLYTDDKEDITAANMTAIINPTIPVGKIWNTNLLVKCFFSCYLLGIPQTRSYQT